MIKNYFLITTTKYNYNNKKNNDNKNDKIK